MDRVSLLVVSIAAAAAFLAKSLIVSVFELRQLKSSTLQIVTASGEKIRIDASKLTPEKAAEIAGARTPAPTAR